MEIEPTNYNINDVLFVFGLCTIGFLIALNITISRTRKYWQERDSRAWSAFQDLAMIVNRTDLTGKQLAMKRFVWFGQAIEFAKNMPAARK